MRLLLALLGIGALTGIAGARTWNVPADAATIASGLDSAQVGDVVAVTDGTYEEHGLVMKRGITLRGASGMADGVVIDGQQSWRIMTLPDGDDLTPTRIEDLTFAGADTNALYCRGDADLVIEGCVFRDGVSQSWPPALAINGHETGKIVVRDCVFRDNANATSCGAVSVSLSRDVLFERCLFLRNHAGVWGAAFCAGYTLGDVVLDQCTITGNTGQDYWAATILVGWAEIQVTRTLVAHNDVQFATTGSNHMGYIAWSCCDLYDNTGDDYTAPWWGFGNGNFSADPCFCAPEFDDFALAADSWCLSGNHPWGCDDRVGAFGMGCPTVDCGGLVTVEPRSWSEIKALYRGSLANPTRMNQGQESPRYPGATGTARPRSGLAAFG